MLTVVLTLSTMLFTWIVGFFIGVYSATHQYSIGDYLFTALGFVGLGVPDFLIALVVIWVAYTSFGANLSGLFSREFMTPSWSLGQGRGSAQASLAADAHPGRGRHRGPDPHDARQPAG